MRELGGGSRLIPDAHLAALAIEHGGRDVDHPGYGIRSPRTARGSARVCRSIQRAWTSVAAPSRRTTLRHKVLHPPQFSS